MSHCGSRHTCGSNITGLEQAKNLFPTNGVWTVLGIQKVKPQGPVTVSCFFKVLGALLYKENPSLVFSGDREIPT